MAFSEVYNKVFEIQEQFEKFIQSTIETREKLSNELRICQEQLGLVKDAFPRDVGDLQDIIMNLHGSIELGRNSFESFDSNVLLDIIEEPRVRGLEDIAGLKDIKKELKTIMLLQKNQPHLFSQRKISNSVLLFGPPGTGKTLLVHALAAEFKCSLFSISISDILSPMLGESERNIQSIFQSLRNTKGFAILFIDEIDGLCKRRSSNEKEYSRKLKTEFLCQLSKMDNIKNVYIFSATNCPWDLDPAVLRRFQKRLYIPLPDSSERLELFGLLTKNSRIELNSEAVNLIIQLTERYSGSDLNDLIQNALNIPLIELDDTKIWTVNEEGIYSPIQAFGGNTNIIFCNLSEVPLNSLECRKATFQDFLNASKNITLTTSLSDIKKFEDFLRN